MLSIRHAPVTSLERSASLALCNIHVRLADRDHVPTYSNGFAAGIQFSSNTASAEDGLHAIDTPSARLTQSSLRYWTHLELTHPTMTALQNGNANLSTFIIVLLMKVLPFGHAEIILLDLVISWCGEFR